MRRTVNVLKLMFLRVSKYMPNGLLHSANNFYKRATRKRNRLNELAQYTIAAAHVEHAFARPMLTSYYIIIASEASFLVSSMARILYIYTYYNYIMFQAVFRAVNVLNVTTYVYLDIRAKSAIQIIINAQRANVTGSMNWHNTKQRPPM